MSRMHQSVREYNIYRWAGLLLGELSRIPDEAIGTPDASIPVVPPWSQGGQAMKTLRDIMRSGFLFMVQKDATVTEAAKMMAAHNIGIVIVLDGDRLEGVFSERDVVRRVVDQGRDPAATRVGDVMTARVVTADAEMDYQSAMRAMDDANIRHLLVMSGEKMLSMVSIRDLMRVDMRDKDEEVQHLREYLYQVPPGAPASRPSAK